MSKACLKIALVLPHDQALAIVIRSKLIDAASELSIRSKGLMSTQVQDLFAKSLTHAKYSADGCAYWLEMVKEEAYLDATIIDPIYKESQDICNLLSLALKKVKPNNY